MPPRWWIVGASEGLGRALARALDAQGAALVLSARSEDRLAELASGLRDARVVAMDVTDAGSVAHAARAAADCTGLIYAAGAYEPMAATDWQPEAAVRMVATSSASVIPKRRICERFISVPLGIR